MNNFLTEYFNLNGKTAFVTGCASGIGQALAIGLASAGANIVGSYYQTDYHLTQKEVNLVDRDLYPLKLDLSQSVDWQHIWDQHDKVMPKIDILLHNAGLNLRSDALSYLEKDWNKSIQINLSTPFQLSQVFARSKIQQQQSGKIINILSLCSYRGGYCNGGYTATKHGLLGITKSLANEWGQYNINVNAIVPGFIKTKMTERFLNDTDKSDSFLRRISCHRWGMPNDLIGSAIFLASKASDYINGESIFVDGGYHNF
jgi:2-deoxy-D-gluconate 3-dehydrogenase